MSVSFKCVLIALVGLCAIASSGVECRPTVITEANWESLLDSGEWMVEFYAPWLVFIYLLLLLLVNEIIT